MASLFPETTLAAAAPVGLGRMMAGGGAKVDRQPSDFYPTPASATQALVAAEHDALSRAVGALAPQYRSAIWEPCGRGGAIAKVLQQAKFTTIATDLIEDPANNVAGANLLAVQRPLSKVVVSNLPFACAEAMIRHLLDDLQCDYVALLFKSTFWHAASRSGLFRRFRPARIYALNWRPDFMGGGAPTMDCIWTVWDGEAESTVFDVLAPATNQATRDLFTP